MESDDYRQYVANLRSIGCPEETIRDIIVADVGKLFAARAKAETGLTNRFEYWKGGTPLAGIMNEETVAKRQALAREKRQLLKTLLGTDVPEKPDLLGAQAEVMEAMLDFLPADKQTQMMELEQKFSAKWLSAMKSASKGDPGEARRLQTEKDAEMLKILSSEEKFEYDLRMSQSAMMLRMQMGDLSLSEQEFRDVFKLRKQVDDQFGLPWMAGTLTKAEQESRDTAQQQMNGQLQQLLGDRYPEYKYEVGGEWAAQMLHRIARENNLSREQAMQAYQLTDVARAEANKLKADASVTDDRRQAALNALYDETAQAVTQVLGTEAAQSYLKKVALIPGAKPPASRVPGNS